MTPGRAHPAGFTLIEVMAVIVIASLVATVAAVSLAGSSDLAQRRAAVTAWQDLDGLARAHARGGGPVVMEVTPDRTAIVVRRGETFLSRVGLGGCTVRTEPPAVTFDARGQSADYRVHLVAGEVTVAWQVQGLTGYVREVAP